MDKLIAEDCILRWPSNLLRAELLREVADPLHPGWEERCKLILEHAFSSRSVLETFESLIRPQFGMREVSPWGPSHPADPRVDWLKKLAESSEKFPTISLGKKYFSERQASPEQEKLSLHSLAVRFENLIDEFINFGYFEEAFGIDCEDQFEGLDPASAIKSSHPREGIWPIDPERYEGEPDLLFDLIEVLDELISGPRARDFHSYNGCGWHHSDFSKSRGRQVYRWRVNLLLRRSEIGFELAVSGQQQGTLIRVIDPLRVELINDSLADSDDRSKGRIQNAIAQFRARDVTPDSKRSACINLAAILEDRRSLLKEELFRKDEGALFQIANEFAVRHHSEKQKDDYDPAFLDWIFWWYLATIDLTNKIIAREVK